MSLFLGENQYFYKKKKSIFLYRTGKVFKIHSFYLVLNLMLITQLTYILPCLLIKPAKIFSCFASKADIFIFRYIFWKCIFCHFIDNRALSYYKNDVHIVNISNGNIIIMFCDIISSTDMH